MSKKIGRRVTAALALGVGAALLAGCAGGAAPSGSQSADAGAGSTGASEERIRVALPFAPVAGLSPFSDDALLLSRLSTAETLVLINDQLEPEAMLATEWEQTDDTTWVFTLREGVTFHDGTPFDAEAVVNALDQAASASPPPRALNGVTLESEATGEHELTITTDGPDPLLPNRLASAQMSILSPAAYAEAGSLSSVGTGTGSFVLKEFSDTTATLDRYEEHWNGAAVAAGIDVSFVADGAARAGAIRSDEVDVAQAIPVSQVTLLDPEAAHPVQTSRTTFLTLNSESGPFTDPGVRAAAVQAIDTQTIVDSVYEGQADVGAGLLGPAIPWAEEMRGDVEPTAEPGEVEGVEITLAAYTNRAELPEVAVQLEQQLEEAGFIVTQDVREYANMEEDLLAGAFDASIMSRNTLLDTGDPLSFMSQDFTCEGGFNVAQLCDPRVDELASAGEFAPVGDERRQATMDLEEAILQTGTIVPLVHDRVVLAATGAWTDVLQDPFERRLITGDTRPAE